MSSISIGQLLLSQFRVDAFVASGGMGAVYRVWDLKRNVPLAMKVLHADLAEDPSVFRRFKREANALKKLTHPNIVPFYGLYETPDFAFLLERYIDGPSLKDILRKHRDKPLPVYEVVTYLKALTAALGYAHANGVVHCDVKPGNVMIDRGGNIYLTDFGVARHSESTTTTLGTAGTPAYMAPEQIRGELVSPATDVYALGVMLYEMLTGQRPFKGDEIGTESAGPTAGERIRYGHLIIPPPDPRLLNPALSPNWAQVILKALAKDPLQRFENMRELFMAACEAAVLDPNALADRVASLPKPVSTPRNQELEQAKGPGEQIASVPFPVGVQGKRRLAPWMVISACILLAGLLLLILFRLLGREAMVGRIDPQSMLPSITSPSVFQLLPTFTHSPTRIALPSLTNTPFLPPTTTSSPTPNSGEPWGQIVFTCQVYKDDTRNQLCIINADGSGIRQLTDISSNYYASVAPDGDSIIFPSFRTGHWEIYELNLYNNNIKQLTNENSEFSAPEIAPDGKSIIMTRNLDNLQRIWMMNRDGGNLHEVVRMSSDCLDPVWSPDGNRILFACGPLNNKQLFIADATGATIGQITNISDLRGRSDWSPLGNEIASYVGPQWHRELVAFDINGANMKYLTNGGNNLAPSYSPDGRWITFTSYMDRFGDDNGCEIYIMRVDGTDIRRLTNNSYCDYQPRWGP